MFFILHYKNIFFFLIYLMFTFLSLYQAPYTNITIIHYFWPSILMYPVRFCCISFFPNYAIFIFYHHIFSFHWHFLPSIQLLELSCLCWRTWRRPRLRSCVITLASVRWRGISWSQHQNHSLANGINAFLTAHHFAQQISTANFSQWWVQCSQENTFNW